MDGNEMRQRIGDLEGLLELDRVAVRRRRRLRWLRELAIATAVFGIGVVVVASIALWGGGA